MMRWTFPCLLALVIVQSLPSAAPAADAVHFAVANDNPGATGERVVSFGQIFPHGAVRPGERLVASLGGAPAPAQIDPKAAWPDGSVRHAVVAVEVPQLRPGQTLQGELTAAPASGPRPAAAFAPPPDVVAELRFRTPSGAPETARIDLAQLMRAPGANAQKPWLDGPLVRERRYEAEPIHGIQVVFDVWTPAAGPARVDVIFRNDLAASPGFGARSYDVSLSLAGRQVWAADGLAHYPYAVWRRTLYADAALPLRITPDVRLLMQTGAVPHYAAIQPDRQATRALARAAQAGAGPLGAGGVTTYMPMTGGRGDIGPLPSWAVFYLLDPSRENLQTLLANADAAGSIPWHVRDPKTDDAVRIDRRPDVWLDPRGRAIAGVLARPYEVQGTRWQPDDAHAPSLTYLPYLLTGSRFYRDELAAHAAYVLAAVNPEYRQHATGLLLGAQVRALAWDFRTLATAAFILPADDPMQPYLQSRLDANLGEIIRRYVDGHEADAAGELKGYVPGPYAVAGAVAPWQQDYLVMVLGWINSMGDPKARPILAWMSNFVAGRFTNGQRGYDPIYGTPYYLYVDDPHTGAPLKTWSAAFRTSFDPVAKPVTSLDYANWAGGYAALARASLASLMEATGSPQAQQAYRFVVSQTPRMEQSYSDEPGFAIAPPADGLTVAGAR